MEKARKRKKVKGGSWSSWGESGAWDSKLRTWVAWFHQHQGAAEAEWSKKRDRLDSSTIHSSYCYFTSYFLVFSSSCLVPFRKILCFLVFHLILLYSGVVEEQEYSCSHTHLKNSRVKMPLEPSGKGIWQNLIQVPCALLPSPSLVIIKNNKTTNERRLKESSTGKRGQETLGTSEERLSYATHIWFTPSISIRSNRFPSCLLGRVELH